VIQIRTQISVSKKPKLSNFIIQLKRSFTIAKKDLKIYYNKPPVLIQGIIFPVILFIAFTIGRAIQEVYLISGLMTMVLFLTSTSIGPIVLPWETGRKTLERLITCPISIKTILMGSIWGSFIYSAFFSLIPLILGAIFLSLLPSMNFIVIIGGMIVGALSFASFSLILSVPPSDTPSSTMVLTVLVKFPLIFITPLFMPISNLPIGVISPLTYLVDIINVGLGDASAFGIYGLLLDFGVLGIFGFGFLLLSFALHKKTLEKRFRG